MERGELIMSENHSLAISPPLNSVNHEGKYGIETELDPTKVDNRRGALPQVPNFSLNNILNQKERGELMMEP
jgi:hypothetical protein